MTRLAAAAPRRSGTPRCPHTINRTTPHYPTVQLHMHQRPIGRGLTRTEVLVVLLVIVIILVVLPLILSPWEGPLAATARSLRDAAQVREIHQSLLVASRELNGSFPLPSLIAAAGDDETVAFSLDHSANLYSSLIVRHYFTPAMLISPIEYSDHVVQANYDFTAYDPLNGSYWDPSFVMHIEDPKIGANASYAHVAAVGDRRHALDPARAALDMPILGTRGPDVTNLDPADYHRSPTYRFSKPYDQWIGNIAFSDNHVETLTTFYPQLTAYPSDNDRDIQDNIFSADFNHPNGPQAAADAFLAIYTAATQFTVQDVYDPLLDE